MKKYLLFAIACVLGLFNLNAQKNVTIGDGSETSSDLPYNNSFVYSASQQIYHSNELNVEGSAVIESIAFKSAAEKINENYIQVYMVNTNKDSYANANEWVPVTENDKVYEGYFTTNGKDQWSKIKLNTPFIVRGDKDLVICVNLCEKYELSTKDQDIFYVYGSTQGAKSYSITLRSSDNLIDVTKVNASTFEGEESGFSSPLSPLRSQLQLGYSSVEDYLITNFESVDFGNIALGDYWVEDAAEPVVVRVSSYYSRITDITCSDTSFFKLPSNIDLNGVVEFVLSYDKNTTAGEKTAEITITDENNEKVVIPIKANVYDPVTPDVFELAKEITFTDGKFTDEPDSTKLYDDYLLPNERYDSYAPDAVYKLELEEESLVLVDIEGSNAKFALYDEKFNGKEGPSFDNAVTGKENTLNTTFSYDFEDGKLDDFTIEDYDEFKDYTWKIENGTLISLSFTPGEGEGHYDENEQYVFTPAMNQADERITTKAYTITPNTVLTFDVRFTTVYETTVLGNYDNLYVQVTKDDSTFTEIAFVESVIDYNAPNGYSIDWLSQRVNVGAKLTELGLNYGEYKISLYHKFGGAHICAVDNFTLTERTTVIPAGKYYLVTAAEDAFKVTVTLGEPKDEELAAPVVTATATSDTTIVLTWNAVEGATSYNVYQGTDTVAIASAVKDTTYTVSGLKAETEYTFTVTAVNAEGQSDKSAEAKATTLKGSGVSIDELASAFNVYPNPVKDELFIATEMNVKEIAIYDVYGRMTKVYGQQTTDFIHSIDVADLNSGIYFVNIKTDNGNVVKRFVKK